MTPHFDMVAFLQALFEEMADLIGSSMTVERL
jgi:hypothetical protein